MNFSILSIGTELTTGQIVNSNSTWISTQLKNNGLEARLHLTVPDETQLILDALNFCAAQSDILFITGGLGPTTDDFTRDVVSSWLDLKLIFDELSWKHIEDLLNSRGIKIQDIQKQQCFFPEGSEVLKNNKGTANGFSILKKINNKTLKIFVLPGPPLEIESIWVDHIADWLKKATVYVDKTTAHSWDTIGIPESEVATLAGTALMQLKKDFPITIGYRVHLPYVEVKLTYPSSVEFTAESYVKKVDQALDKITVLRNFEKASELFNELIGSLNFAFYDFVTGGFFHKSLSQSLNKKSEWLWKQSAESMDADFFSNEENFIALIQIDEISCQLAADFKGKKFLKVIESPLRFNSNIDRKFQYFTEMALIEFIRFYKK